MSVINEMVLGVIPARCGSKGVPGKNIRPVFGKPLIAYAIECGLKCRSIDQLIVTTDSKEIAHIARKWGADVPFLRPAELAGNEVPMLPVLQHALTESESYYDKTAKILVLLDPTGPLRTVADIDACLKILRESNCDAVVSGNKAHRSPYFNMVMLNNDYAQLVFPSPDPIGRRQDSPPLYDLNTVVWAYSRKALMVEKARIPKRTRLLLIPPERAIDIDTEHDFEILKFLMGKKMGLKP